MPTMCRSRPTEAVTDSYDQNIILTRSTSCRHIADPGIVRERAAAFTGYTPPLQQQHPNDRFYCSDHELEEENSIHPNRINWNLRWSQDEDEEELPWKQAAEVAAAARFIAKADIVIISPALTSPARITLKPRLGSTTQVRDSILDTSLHIPRSRSASMQQPYSFTQKLGGRRPPPLDLHRTRPVPEDVQSPLPQRVSSRGAPSFDVARPPLSGKECQSALLSPSVTSEPKTPLTVLTPENANMFQFDFGISNEPRLSRSGSGSTADTFSPMTPTSEPSEDQIRRDIEAFALERSPYLRGVQKRTRRLPSSNIANQHIDFDQLLPISPKQAQQQAAVPPSDIPTEDPIFPESNSDQSMLGLRRKKTIFGWLQKKSDAEAEVEVDELIDLYLTDEQKDEVKSVRQRPTRPKLTIFRNRVATDPGPIGAG